MISVIIPVYNSVDYLDECVASVVKQSVKDWECILVDDGSSDGSERKCDEWSVKDNRIIVIHQKNVGVSIARNMGIERSKGDYLYFLDSDDWCEPSLFEHFDDDDMIFGEYILGDMHIVSKHDYSGNYALSYLKDDLRACMGSFAVKKNIVQQHDIRFEPARKYAEDLSFILRCLLYTKNVNVVNTVFMHYRQVPSSAVHTFNLGRFDAYFSRLWLLNEVMSLRNDGVNAFLHHYACVESIILVTKELFARGYSVNLIKEYYREHPVMYFTLIRAMKDTTLRRDYAQSAKYLIYCPWVYKLMVVATYRWYDLHACLGKLKQNIFRG